MLLHLPKKNVYLICFVHISSTCSFYFHFTSIMHDKILEKSSMRLMNFKAIESLFHICTTDTPKYLNIVGITTHNEIQRTR